MAVQVDENKTVGEEAFARIAPACAAVADVLTVHNLFDALTSSSCHQLHFFVYDKYLRSLDKVFKVSKKDSKVLISTLQLAEGEIILDVDGTIPSLPVLQHIGISACEACEFLIMHPISLLVPCQFSYSFFLICFLFLLVHYFFFQLADTYQA